jgi:SAM-dependent methyltransferase
VGHPIADGDKADYSNWVSTKLIYAPVAAGVAVLALSVVIPALIVAAALLFLAAGYFAYARYRFSPAGGNVQSQVQNLLLGRVDWTGQGKALDIGCGSGALTIRLAKEYPQARITGIDYWGGAWEYSKGLCERNAEIEGVAGRVDFQKASASALPSPDGCFDLAVSNLVFHEVGDAKDKREVMREALRVVRKGGRFAFQDLFQSKALYGDVDDLVVTMRGWGLAKVEYAKSSDAPFIPTALKLPFMLGTMSMLYGEK